MIPQASGALSVRERLIVALDVPTVDDARALVERLGDSVEFYKIGMQLQFGGGLAYVDELVGQGKKVFLDAKLFDIDATIEQAVRSVARMGVEFLTVHGPGKTIRAAVAGRGGSKLKILSVTVLTSLDNDDLADLYGRGEVDVTELVRYRAENAIAAGADGVIASGHEAALIKQLVDAKVRVLEVSDERPRLRIVTPGIRLSGAAADDQKRVSTPASAIKAGADYLVVGRPISQSADPRATADAIVAEIAAAL